VDGIPMCQAQTIIWKNTQVPVTWQYLCRLGLISPGKEDDMAKIASVNHSLSAVLCLACSALGAASGASEERLQVSLLWGHRSPTLRSFHIHCQGQGITITVSY